MAFAPVVNDHGPSTSRVVPTDDAAVRLELRKLNEPITLFGEGKPERRERLQTLWSERKHTDFGFEVDQDHDMDEEEEEEDSEDDEFYTPGPQELLTARTDILRYSVAKARDRVQKQRQIASGLDFTQVLRHRRHIAAEVAKYELNGSYTLPGNTRALSCVRFNGTNDKLGCSSWDGSIHVLRAQNGDYVPVASSKSGFHNEKATFTWSSTDPNILISGGAEGTTNIWDFGTDGEVSPKHTITGSHGARIAQVASHPSGSYYCTTSFDQTWKLWDLNKPDAALMEQEGHSKEVYACSFHPDGSLLATGGLDAIGRVWDLRSGRSISILDTHIKGIYSMAWSPNGYHLASGSGDNSVKIWDMRKQGELFSIPAHSKLVSDVRFVSGGTSKLAQPVADEQGNEQTLELAGTILVTSSYDGTVKMWSADNWVGMATLKGHTDKVMSCDVSSGGETVVSCGWDRTLRTFN